MGKNPTIAAILNFFLSGAGYLYLGKKRAFGSLVLLGSIAAWIHYYLAPPPQNWYDFSILDVGYFIFGVGFAYDAYTLARAERPSEQL